MDSRERRPTWEGMLSVRASHLIPLHVIEVLNVALLVVSPKAVAVGSVVAVTLWESPEWLWCRGDEHARDREHRQQTTVHSTGDPHQDERSCPDGTTRQVLLGEMRRSPQKVFLGWRHNTGGQRQRTAARCRARPQPRDLTHPWRTAPLGTALAPCQLRR